MSDKIAIPGIKSFRVCFHDTKIVSLFNISLQKYKVENLSVYGISAMVTQRCSCSMFRIILWKNILDLKIWKYIAKWCTCIVFIENGLLLQKDTTQQFSWLEKLALL